MTTWLSVIIAALGFIIAAGTLFGFAARQGRRNRQSQEDTLTAQTVTQQNQEITFYRDRAERFEKVAEENRGRLIKVEATVEVLTKENDRFRELIAAGVDLGTLLVTFKETQMAASDHIVQRIDLLETRLIHALDRNGTK